MKSIAQFYTLFWIIYFPTCIAFNKMGAMKYVDEVMTVILIAYTMLQISRRRYLTRGINRSYKQLINGKIVITTNVIKESKQYILILLFFVCYGLMFGENVKAAVLRDMVQWIRPFSVIYCTWILNPQFTRRQIKLMLWSMLATIFAWLLIHPLVLEGEGEFPTLGQLVICTGMAWYILTKKNRKNAYIALGIVCIGLLAPKFKFLGEVVCFIFMIFFLKKKFNFKSPKTVITLALIMVIVLAVTWTKFDVYYVSGMNSITMARPMTYRIGFTQILWDYFPFGPGMGTWGCAAAADFYSPLLYKYHMNKVWGCSPTFSSFIADAFYPTLCQLGVVGIFFFCVFWKRRLKEINVIIDMRYYRVAWISFFCLAIEQTADTSFLSGKGMGYCMLLALCLNANRNLLKNAKMVSGTENDREVKEISGAEGGHELKVP